MELVMQYMRKCVRIIVQYGTLWNTMADWVIFFEKLQLKCSLFAFGSSSNRRRSNTWNWWERVTVICMFIQIRAQRAISIYIYICVYLRCQWRSSISRYAVPFVWLKLNELKKIIAKALNNRTSNRRPSENNHCTYLWWAVDASQSNSKDFIIAHIKL